MNGPLRNRLVLRSRFLLRRRVCLTICQQRESTHAPASWPNPVVPRQSLLSADPLWTRAISISGRTRIARPIRLPEDLGDQMIEADDYLVTLEILARSSGGCEE